MLQPFYLQPLKILKENSHCSVNNKTTLENCPHSKKKKNTANISSNENEARLLHLCSEQNIQIHIQLIEEIDVALNRMDQRKTNNSRVEKEQNKTRKRELMLKFEKGSNQIEKHIAIQGNNRAPDVIAQEVMEKLLALREIK